MHITVTNWGQKIWYCRTHKLERFKPKDCGSASDRSVLDTLVARRHLLEAIYLPDAKFLCVYVAMDGPFSPTYSFFDVPRYGRFNWNQPIPEDNGRRDDIRPSRFEARTAQLGARAEEFTSTMRKVLTDTASKYHHPAKAHVQDAKEVRVVRSTRVWGCGPFTPIPKLAFSVRHTPLSTMSIQPVCGAQTLFQFANWAINDGVPISFFLEHKFQYIPEIHHILTPGNIGKSIWRAQLRAMLAI
ncbi:hypothetical protein BDK51DRAFT_31594 [Blyttiomyces helicus]|uniref:Uncharacterized protein n=1 Tax=Blyttiomyces helicus TaxID=388810 RepID=A0A4P9WK62_9FUNG|nr:hypothetical protein BDK51DRAFT_31594 [Blyttiomyces helicus]|eukprot:RKO92782.1 hypothetical protein BDK51DRAFT_31594 [Blyttiomyces helicus]